MGKTTRTMAACVVALAGMALVAGGCRSAQRGAPYKRLISSYAEAVHLKDLSDQRLMEAVRAGQSPDRIESIASIHDEATMLEERWHDSLDLRRREYFNRTTTNRLWGRYVELFPEDKDLREEYRGQRRIAIDEIRSRRTPLTHDQRLPWAPPPKDPLPYGPEAKAPRPAKVTGPSLAASTVYRAVPQRDFTQPLGSTEPAREGSWVTPPPAEPDDQPPAQPAAKPAAQPPAPAPRPPRSGSITIEPLAPSGSRPGAPPVDLDDPQGEDPTEEMLMDLLEEQATRPRK